MPNIHGGLYDDYKPDNFVGYPNHFATVKAINKWHVDITFHYIVKDIDGNLQIKDKDSEHDELHEGSIFSHYDDKYAIKKIYKSENYFELWDETKAFAGTQLYLDEEKKSDSKSNY